MRKKARVARKPPPEKAINLYGLEALGYADSLGLVGSYAEDQPTIESICYRIDHRPEEGGVGKAQHMLNFINLLWGDESVGRNKRYVPNSWSDQILRDVCENKELGVAGPTSAGKSDPIALYAAARYTMDPTHTLILMLSTTLTGAKKRIWKTFREYWEAVPDLPGKPLWSTNEIQGTSYDGEGYGQSSGIYLLASEQSSEKAALDKLIGIKAPRTGEPGADFEELMSSGDYDDLAEMFELEHLKDLVVRLQNLEHDRIGEIIMLIDEATGCAPSILNVINSNLKPGNVGHFQVVMIANPHTYYDVFGLFCKPENGWNSVNLANDEWRTATGGKVIRFNAEENPRIVEKNEKFSWMLRMQDIKEMKETYGPDSLYVWRMCYGMFRPAGAESGVYNQADLAASDAVEKTTWGFEKPVKLSSLDPSFSAGGDAASASFFKYGLNALGVQTLEVETQVKLQININDKKTPVSYQIIRAWRKECEKRGIYPNNCAYDATGGGGPFGDIVRVEWSSQVMGVSSGGKASRHPAGNEKDQDGKKILCRDRYANKATEIWHGAMPFFRSGQIRGVSTDLAKQLISRQYDKGGLGDARVLKVESKRVYKSREGSSPDDSDSFLLGVELAKRRHGFRPSEKAGVVPGDPAQKGKSNSWAQFCKKARKLSAKKGLQMKS